jgi:hypothetical protein
MKIFLIGLALLASSTVFAKCTSITKIYETNCGLYGLDFTSHSLCVPSKLRLSGWRQSLKIVSASRSYRRGEPSDVYELAVSGPNMLVLEVSETWLIFTSSDGGKEVCTRRSSL